MNGGSIKVHKNCMMTNNQETNPCIKIPVVDVEYDCEANFAISTCDSAFG